ncbi:MAG: hypothetical protein K2N01_12805 [Lachnospiraceae bacterium]|nr:hypothetical protein [Lachnospiraceae bacterium]
MEYTDVREEVKDLRNRVNKLQNEIWKLENSVVSDSVTCGKKGKKPLKTVKITGTPIGKLEKKKIILRSTQAKLEEEELRLLELQDQAEEYIEKIEKSELRVMFRFYFIDGLSYPQTAMRMNETFPDRNIKYTDENVKKRIQRFFKMSPNVPVKDDIMYLAK